VVVAVPNVRPAGQRPWTGAEAAAAGLALMGARPSIPRYVRQLWDRREFAMLVPLGDLRQRNMDTVLGSAWHVLNPLFQAGIYYLLFGILLDQRAAVANYPVWLIIGLFVFGFTQKSLQSSSRTIVSRVAMLRSLNFPAAILPIAMNISELLAHLPAIGVMLVFVLVSGIRPSVSWLLLVPLTLVQAMMNVGLSLIVARLTVHFRDLDHMLTHLVRMWFYFSGVLFAIDLAPVGWMRTLLTVNPPYVFISIARDALLEGRVDPARVGLAAAWATGLFVLGFLFFHRFEGRYSGAA
jgi:teichoic acid transport system permease protein